MREGWGTQRVRVSSKGWATRPDFPLSRFAFFKFARVNRKLPRSTHSGVTCLTPPPDAEGSALGLWGRFIRRPAFSPSVRLLGEDEYQVSHSEKNDPC